MTFTDDDLKRLKERLDDGQGAHFISTDETKALLARLEAAERYAYYHDPGVSTDPESNKLRETWRKAAGRE